MASALERCTIYRGLAEAFREPAGGVELLDESLIPPPSKNATQAFLEAFDPSVYDSACSLHESDHSTRGQTSLFEELVRWHEHFGLRRTDTALLPDHVSAELEFMHFLTFSEHKNETDEAGVAALRRAQRDFLTRHLLPLAEAISVKCSSPEPRYRALAQALPQFLQTELQQL
ncbi:MAG: molecular chaperone TorD family protein [Hyphomicrobiales bacterium]